MRHPDTPRRAGILAGAGLAYAASPVDLIPDGIPVVGYVDDVVVVPLVRWLTFRLVPPEVREEERRRVGFPRRTAVPGG